MKGLFASDDELPDWAHTAAVMAIAGAFALPWFWSGLGALFSGRLAPMMGPDFGVWMFGGQALAGRAARFGGLTLVLIGAVFVLWGLACTRWAEGRRTARIAPWCVLALALLVYRFTMVIA